MVRLLVNAGYSLPRSGLPGKVTRLGGLTRQSIISHFRVTRQAKLPGLPDLVIPSTGVDVCHLSPPRWSNPLSRGRIRVTSISRQLPLAEALKVTTESHMQQEQPSQNRRKNTSFARHFLVYLLSSHSIIMGICTPGWRGCKIACKRGLFFYPHSTPGAGYLTYLWSSTSM